MAWPRLKTAGVAVAAILLAMGIAVLLTKSSAGLSDEGRLRLPVGNGTPAVSVPVPRPLPESRLTTWHTRTEQPAPDNPEADAKLVALLETSLAALPFDERRLLEAKYFAHRSVREVAQELDLSEKVTESRLVRKTQLLMSHLALSPALSAASLYFLSMASSSLFVLSSSQAATAFC
jgi:hypothetical protein